MSNDIPQAHAVWFMLTAIAQRSILLNALCQFLDI